MLWAWSLPRPICFLWRYPIGNSVGVHDKRHDTIYLQVFITHQQLLTSTIGYKIYLQQELLDVCCSCTYLKATHEFYSRHTGEQEWDCKLKHELHLYHSYGLYVNKNSFYNRLWAVWICGDINSFVCYVSVLINSNISGMPGSVSVKHTLVFTPRVFCLPYFIYVCNLFCLFLRIILKMKKLFKLV